MLVQLTNDYTFVRGATDDELEWIRGLLRFEEKGRTKGKKQVHHLFDLASSAFPSGLLAEVQRAGALRSPPIKLDVADCRKRPCDPDQNADLSFARDYQIEAVKRVWARTRGILQLPTGAGKTTIAVGIVSSIPCRWLFLVDQKDLTKQAADRYTSITGVKAGVIGDGIWDPQEFTVATFQTLYSRIGDAGVQRYLSSVQGIIVDETHTLPAATFWRVMSLLDNAYWRVGLSATPLDRLDGRSVLVVAAIGAVIHKVPPELLIERGYLTRPDIRMVECAQPTPRNMHQTPFAQLRKKLIVSSDIRNQVVLECADKVAKPALVFIKELSHGRYIAKELRKRGWRTELVSGSASVPQRQALIKSLEGGDLDIVVCSSVFTKGVDIPSLAGGVNAAGGKSTIEALQRIGRGLRVVKGKDVFEWYDLYDTNPPMLKRHAEERRVAYLSCGYDVRNVKSAIAEAAALKASIRTPAEELADMVTRLNSTPSPVGAAADTAAQMPDDVEPESDEDLEDDGEGDDDDDDDC